MNPSDEQSNLDAGRMAAEEEKWVTAVEYVLDAMLKNHKSQELYKKVAERLRNLGIETGDITTPYVNTIPLEKEPSYPGDHAIEWRIRSYIRWNAMAMVVKANRLHPGIGGHISTFASCATLYEVAFNHFLRGRDRNRLRVSAALNHNGVRAHVKQANEA